MTLEIYLNGNTNNFFEIDKKIKVLIVKEDEDILKFIKKSFDEFNEIVISCCEESNFNQISMLFSSNKKIIIDSDNLSYSTLQKLKETFGNNFYVRSKYNLYEDVLVDEYFETMDKLYKMKEEIEKYNLSPLEKIIYIYDLVKERIYKKSSLSEAYSRDLTKVLKEDEIVCAGYANIMSNLTNLLGINTYVKNYYNEEKNDGHATVGIYLNDFKYNIHGVFECDPTWDSKKSVDDEKFINNYAWCMESFKASEKKKEYRLIPKNDDLLKGLTKAYQDLFNKSIVYDILKNSFFNIFYKKASNFYKTIGLFDKANEVLKLIDICEIDNVNDIYNDILSYFNIKIEPTIFIKALYNARRFEYLNNPSVRRLTFDDIESSINNKYNLNMMSRISFLIEYGTIESIIFGEDDICIDDEFSKIEKDRLKLRLLYDLRVILEDSSSSDGIKRIKSTK